MTKRPASETRRSRRRGTLWRQLGLRLLALALALVGTLALAELALRVAGYSPAHLNPLKAFHVADPVVGHRGRAGYQGRFKRPEFDILVRHDERGFRRPAKNPDPRRCEHKVLVYGDSYVWGWGVEEGWLLTDRLAELRPDLCVYNYGINGSGTAMQYTLFRHEHAEGLAEGDTVVVLLYRNDFTDNTRGRSLQAHVVDGEVHVEVVRQSMTSPVRRWLKDHSYLVNLAAYAADAWSLNRDRRRSTSRVHRGLDPDSEEVLVARHFLTRFREDVEGRGARLLVSMVPGDDDDLTATTGRLARECGIDFFDVTQAFAEAEAHEGTALRYPVDGHWTAAGHALMARLLAGKL